MYWILFLSHGLNTEYWIGCGGEESFRSLEGYFDVYFIRTSHSSSYIIPYLSHMANVSHTIWKWTHQTCKKSSALYPHNSCALFYQCIFIYSCHKYPELYTIYGKTDSLYFTVPYMGYPQFLTQWYWSNSRHVSNWFRGFLNVLYKWTPS